MTQFGVRQAPPGGRPRGCAPGRDEPEGEDAEEQGLLRVGVHEVRRNADHPERPRSDDHEMENADEVIRRRMPGALLVTVVEPIETGQCDPDGQREEEDEKFRPRRYPVVQRPAGYDFGEREGSCQTEEIREKKQTADERSAAPKRPGAASVLEDLERPVVDCGCRLPMRERGHEMTSCSAA